MDIQATRNIQRKNNVDRNTVNQELYPFMNYGLRIGGNHVAEWPEIQK